MLPPCFRSYMCRAAAVPGTDAVAFPQAEVQSMVEDLHAHEQRYVLIVDPGIASGPGTEVVRLRLLQPARAAVFGGHVRCRCMCGSGRRLDVMTRDEGLGFRV